MLKPKEIAKQLVGLHEFMCDDVLLDAMTMTQIFQRGLTPTIITKVQIKLRAQGYGLVRRATKEPEYELIELGDSVRPSVDEMMRFLSGKEPKREKRPRKRRLSAEPASEDETNGHHPDCQCITCMGEYDEGD